MYYYYKIENKINNNKYIGITTTPSIRKNRHFNYLRQHKHFNPHLQAAFDKYGEQNFYFEIIEGKNFENEEEAYKYEAYLIDLFDTYNNGYNCNPGGKWTGPRGRFTEREVYYIKSAYYYTKRPTGILAKIFNCPDATIYNIGLGRNYTNWCNNFDTFSEEEKKQYYEDFCAESNFPMKYTSSYAHKKSRRFTEQEVFFIYLNDEKKLTSWASLRKKLNVANRGENFMRIRNGTTYKDTYAKYKKLPEKEKQELLCLYTEMYIE